MSGNKYLLALFFLGFAGCYKIEPEKNIQREGYETVSLVRSVTDVMLPAELWDKMESVYNPTFTEGFGKQHESKPGEKAVSTKIEVPTQYMPLKVFLKEEDREVLGGKNLELVFGLGGGELDLKSFVKKSKKEFSLAVELGESVGMKDTLKVYYLSNAKKEKVGNLEWGAGCNKYFDITSFFWKKLSGRGINVNTGSLRHLRLLAGSYFFVLNKNNALYLAQLKITDSRYKDIYCRI